MSKTNKTLVISALLAAVLAGCGGGGGGDSGTGGGGTTPTNPTGTDLQTSVPAPTYAAGSPELDAWNVLQQARDACGFGMLAQDTRLDAAAKAHANYLSLNNTMEHTETPGQPGFTGATPADRAKAQGFSGTYVSELLAFRASGRLSMEELLAVPYHLRNATDTGYRFVGFAFKAGARNMLAVMPGRVDLQGQKLGKGVVANYPCENAQNVSNAWLGENPDPFPDLASQYKGTSIVLRADQGSNLTIANFSVTKVSTGGSITFRTITKQSDANSRFGSHEFVAVPVSALDVGETYSVTYSGDLDGVKVQKTFTFKPTIKYN
jgi:uncharacterized protein YkwD